MLGELAPDWYTSSAVFERERVNLFSKLWMFAGLRPFAGQPDMYFRCRVAGRELVIQNFEGELRAFANVCKHRGKLIQVLEFGRRPLVCGYHGWRYAKDGSVHTIPFEADHYRLDPIERCALRLVRYPLREVGNFVFVNLAESPLSIEEQFSPGLLDTLRSVSLAFDSEILTTRFHGNYNWKLAYENLRDALHPRFVHTTTLSPDVQFEAELPSTREASDSGLPPLPALSYGGPEGTFLRAKGLPFHKQVKRWGTDDSYFNWLLYPNTHVLSADGGHSFSIEHHNPESPRRTEVSVYYMTATKRKKYFGSTAVLWGNAKGAKVVLDEDTQVLEQTQKGLEGGAEAVTQGTFEWRNRACDRWYMGMMSMEGGS